MTVEIRPARNDEERRQAFELRARVFIGEDILDREHESGLLFDVFDALPSSETIIAINSEGVVVGTVRATLHTDQQTPCDDYAISDEALPVGAVIGSGSMLCVAPAQRNSTLGLRLAATAMRYLHDLGVTHGIAPIRPEAEPILSRLGWFRIGEPFIDPTEHVPVIPMAVDVTKQDRFLKLSQRPVASAP